MCTQDRERIGCTHPLRCCSAAQQLLDNLNIKWKPNYLPPDDKLTLTRHRKDKNRRALLEGKALTFNPSVTAGDNVSDGFWVFANPSVTSHLPAHPALTPPGGRWHKTVVYTDGSCIHNGAANARAGTGVWYGPNDPRNLATRVPGSPQTNQTGEILAIQRAAALAPPAQPLHIISDSRYTIDGLTVHLPKWRDRGWVGVNNALLFQSTAYHLQKRSAVTTFEWVKGHTGLEGNEGADKLASLGAAKELPDDVDFTIPNQWNLTGVKITALTQAVAYAGIKLAKPPTPRTAAETNLDKTYHCVHDHLGGQYPTRATIWKSLRHKDIERKISNFLWKAMHHALRVGNYWTHIQSLEYRANCSICGEEDSIAHILTECDAPECTRIWTLCENLWRQKAPDIPWPGKHIGNILGAPLADFKTTNGRRLTGPSRLYRIMMTESAHLI
ncbi:ribonuclease H-like domain-containing protein [Cytidiella melzeri]|nr:ribonuclease H-like domain-containing protein [Cytidiella melzeri]